jgi:hypothetical protein
VQGWGAKSLGNITAQGG